MRQLYVIGDPIGHSKSPLIHNTMLRALGLDYLYSARRVPRGEAPAWLAQVRQEDCAGFNVTIPHKQALVPCMDVLDEDAVLYGAVNTVCLREGRVYGFNTDGQGFFRALTDAGETAEGKRVLLLGAGGAARAVALKLAQQGAERVCICNRTVERAAALCAQDPTGRLTPADFRPETLRRETEQAQLLVNCTSLGMEGVAERFAGFDFLDGLRRDTLVYDLIYNPAETELLAQTRRRGLRTLNGLPMLIYQAIFALEHFTGTQIDPAPMLELLRPLLVPERRG